METEKRIAAHEKRASMRVSTFGAQNSKHIPIYRLVNEDFRRECVTIDYTCYYSKPEHLNLATDDGLHFRNSRKRARNVALESTWKDGG